MAYKFNSLRTIGYASNIGAGRSLALHHYCTSDAATAVETSGYFDDAYKYLGVGDIITAVVGIGGTMKLKQYLVTASSASGVTVALQTTASG